jgi:hypothetical protein
MKPWLVPLVLLAVSVSPVSLPAAEPSPEVNADIGLVDTIHGTFGVAGEAHRLAFFAPAGTKLKTTLAPEGTPDPGATLAVEGPGPGGAVLTVPGFYDLVVSGTTPGKYLLTVKGKPGSKTTIPATDLAPGERVEIPFGAYAGAVLSFKLKGATAVSLTDPVLVSTPLSGTKGSKIPLGRTGVWTIEIEGLGGPASGSITAKQPKVAKREMWLSAGGFGPRPVIASVTPPDALMGRTATGIEVTGTGIDPDADVRLSGKSAQVPALDTTPITDGLSVDFDLSGAAAGKWTLRLVNPSGAPAETTFTVVDPVKVALPDGVTEETEVFHLDFTEDFRQSLSLFGLRSGVNATLDDYAASAVATYTLYHLRRFFLLDGTTGELPADGTVLPVSFVLEAPPALLGAPGTAWNRIVIGGNISDASASDHPTLNWGLVPVDAGNAALENVDGGGATVLFGIAEMDPGDTDRTTSDFRGSFIGMRASKLTASDAVFFRPWADGNRYYPKEVEYARMALIAGTINRLAREMAAVLAHHVGRSLGLANGDWFADDSPSGLPDRYGDFSANHDATFTSTELDTLAANLAAFTAKRALPGKSSELKGEYFPLFPTDPYLLADATTMVSYPLLAFATAGGRPDIEPEDVRWEGMSGTIPAGFGLTGAGIFGGKAPFESATGWYYGVYKFSVGAEDTGRKSDWFIIGHRLNLLINTALISDPNLRAVAEGINADVKAQK